MKELLVSPSDPNVLIRIRPERPAHHPLSSFLARFESGVWKTSLWARDGVIAAGALSMCHGRKVVRRSDAGTLRAVHDPRNDVFVCCERSHPASR